MTSKSGSALELRICQWCCGGGTVYASATDYPHTPLTCPKCDGTGEVFKPKERPICLGD